MQIIGFSQLRNELSKGNLHNWFKSMEFCDYIYIYDQASDDGSQEVYKQHDNVVVIQSNTNRFVEEITCKKALLEKLLKEHPYTDWIFWMDGDTCLDKRLASDKCLLTEILYNNGHADGISLMHLNLWRSNRYARIDSRYNDLRPVCFWKNNESLYFPETTGLHTRTAPMGIKLVKEEFEYNLIHYGFSTSDQIINKYHVYESFGQSGWALDRLIDESRLGLIHVGDYCLPDFIDSSHGCLPDGSYDNTRKSLRDIFNEQ